MCMSIIFFTACSQNLTNKSGYIVSPLYPGYYSNNIECTWRITAPKGHVIHLKFEAFRMEDDPVCANDFVEVRDGGELSSHVIGRYCGHVYPEIVESSTNKLLVQFSSNDDVVRTGFKAFYQTKSGKYYISCLLQDHI